MLLPYVALYIWRQLPTSLLFTLYKNQPHNHSFTYHLLIRVFLLLLYKIEREFEWDRTKKKDDHEGNDQDRCVHPSPDDDFDGFINGSWWFLRHEMWDPVFEGGSAGPVPQVLWHMLWQVPLCAVGDLWEQGRVPLL